MITTEEKEVREDQSIGEMIDNLIQTSNRLIETASILAKIYGVSDSLDQSILKKILDKLSNDEWSKYAFTQPVTTTTTAGGNSFITSNVANWVPIDNNFTSSISGHSQ